MVEPLEGVVGPSACDGRVSESRRRAAAIFRVVRVGSSRGTLGSYLSSRRHWASVITGRDTAVESLDRGGDPCITRWLV